MSRRLLDRRRRREPLTQYGALPFRLEEGEPQVLLVTSRETHRWIIPKGWPERRMAPYEVAAMEAFEEAGVRGQVAPDPIGSFTYRKRLKSGKQMRCRVTMFLLRVEEELDEWRERAERERSWMPPAEAARKVQEEELVAFLQTFIPPAE